MLGISRRHSKLTGQALCARLRVPQRKRGKHSALALSSFVSYRGRDVALLCAEARCGEQHPGNWPMVDPLPDRALAPVSAW